MTTLYEELEKNLGEHNLSWNDIEAIVLTSDKIKIYDKDTSKEIFGRTEINENLFGGYSDIEPFYVYTKDRIFYVGVGDELGSNWIASLPRNPTDKEEPRHLPT